MNRPPLCFETICVEQRQFSSLLPFHEARLNRTRQALWGETKGLVLRDLLALPHFVTHAKHKCRVTYGRDLVQVEWEAYQPKIIESLRLVDADKLVYAHKYKNRESLNLLYAQRADCDDVLIVRKGLITDTSYANVALFDGDHWYTPEHPLLAGTQRAFLLAEGAIIPRAIRAETLREYLCLKLFNAMLPWQEGPTVVIDRVILR